MLEADDEGEGRYDAYIETLVNLQRYDINYEISAPPSYESLRNSISISEVKTLKWHMCDHSFYFLYMRTLATVSALFFGCHSCKGRARLRATGMAGSEMFSPSRARCGAAVYRTHLTSKVDFTTALEPAYARV